MYPIVATKKKIYGIGWLNIQGRGPRNFCQILLRSFPWSCIKLGFTRFFNWEGPFFTSTPPPLHFCVHLWWEVRLFWRRGGQLTESSLSKLQLLKILWPGHNCLKIFLKYSNTTVLKYSISMTHVFFFYFTWNNLTYP